ncbi:DUF5134 domain-containing protein [Nocardia jinanensis]|uniref:DUF5134 domain-containing protein n=1 Tax=Nocardia jinanensis TaxID=382504 RepID=A0A917VM99_9NOCA|nr:DUF5134 domain-containing protein [Nocardia jinanensis]GGK95231.1 hypothetical protein GCM10011588_06920 [Nocardia jinanensis]
MAGFVLDQPGARALAALAFGVAALVVLARVMFAEPMLTTGEHGAVGCAGHSGGTAHGGDHESDAAHLLMCAVMVAMVLFPAEAHAHTLHGVLLAMTLVFTLLLGDRLVRWYRGDHPRAGHRAAAIGYHLAAAVVMLFTMSGHSGHGAGHAGGPALVFAALFLVDAAVVMVSARRGRAHWWAAHPVAPEPGRGVSVAAWPHLIMDLGMAYMLVA